MNEDLQTYARRRIIDGLLLLPKDHQMIFKRMYSPKNLEADIGDVVEAMPEDRLDWAMEQVQRSLSKNLTQRKRHE